MLRYVANLLTKNISGLKSILGGIDAIKDYKSIINAVLDQIGTSSADQIIRALFYLLQENPTNAFWNYSEYQTKDYKFSLSLHCGSRLLEEHSAYAGWPDR